MEENKKDVLPLEGEPLTTPQISEPVVNALAAALNKIETYVPTQYINDGPPDIDAEHLNHAEQAIMRVTNLANGAADAISALQSQVTQLNSDFQYKELTNEFDLNKALGKYRTDSSAIIASLKNKPSEIRNYGETTLDWYPANERNTYGIQIMRWTFRNTHMIFTRNKTENTWAKWVQCATKSDLFSNVALVTDVHNIGKSCLFRAEYGSANTPTSDLGYIGISVCVGSNWKFVICSPYSGGKLFFDSVNTSGSWIGWKEIAFK